MVRTQMRPGPEFEDFILRTLHPLSRFPKSYLNWSLDHRNYSPKDYRSTRSVSFEEDEEMFDFDQQAIWDSILHQNIVSPDKSRPRQSLEPRSTKSHPFSRRSLLDSPGVSEVTVIPIIFERSPSTVDKNKSKNLASKALPQSHIVIDDVEGGLARPHSPILIDDEPLLTTGVSRLLNKNKSHLYPTKDCLQLPVVVDNVSPHVRDTENKKLSQFLSSTDNIQSTISSPSKLCVNNNHSLLEIKDPVLVNIEDQPCPAIVGSHDVKNSSINVDRAGSSKCFVEPAPSYPIYAVLKRQLDKEERLLDYVKGDGNCFFRALSKLMYGTDAYHKAVRSLIVDIIATNKDKFTQFVDGEDVQNHVERMSENQCWATTCEIYAAATLLQRDIYMLTPNHSNDKYSWLLFRPVFERQIQDVEFKSRPCCYITLCNTNGNHYDRIVPNHGSCNCFLPHPQLDGIRASVDLTDV